mmetsp:Transcript_16758/g.40002  ORF Transcript_16758/g.40002 Transcript_16758/m.40002 type:complete len:92 (-) Transcript_16758:102-377(-)
MSVYPALAGTTFSCLFNLARHRVCEAHEPPRFQAVLVLLLLVASFAVHIAYLPAGMCCLVALLLCQNELLLPQKRHFASPSDAAKSPTKKD